MKQALIKVMIRCALWSYCRQQTNPRAICNKKLFTFFLEVTVNGGANSENCDREKQRSSDPTRFIKAMNISKLMVIKDYIHCKEFVKCTTNIVMLNNMLLYLCNTPCCCWSFCGRIAVCHLLHALGVDKVYLYNSAGINIRAYC